MLLVITEEDCWPEPELGSELALPFAQESFTAAAVASFGSLGAERKPREPSTASN